MKSQPGLSTQKLIVFDVTDNNSIDTAITTLVERGAGAVLVGSGPFMNSHREKLIALASHYALPAIYTTREAAVAGGLVSYGTSLTDALRQTGIYVGRILKGEKPANLPVMRATKFEFVINLKTAKTLGLELHPQLLSIAGKWLELLGELAPGVKETSSSSRPVRFVGHRAICRDPSARYFVRRCRAHGYRRTRTDRGRQGIVRIRWRARRRCDCDGQRGINRTTRATIFPYFSISVADSLSIPILRGWWRPCLVRSGFGRHLRAVGRICRSNTQGFEAIGPSGPGTHAV